MVFPALVRDSKVIRCLNQCDLPMLLALHGQIHQELRDSTLMIQESDSFFARHLHSSGRILGVFAGYRLIAYAVLGLPKIDDPYNFGHYLSWDGRKRQYVAHLDGVGVLPGWRGHGLHHRLGKARITMASNQQRRYILATVAPHNGFSLANLRSLGLQVRHVIADFGGFERLLLYRDLANSRALLL